MDRLRDKKNDEQGLLSMIDAVLFGIIMLVVTMLIFQQFGGALTRERDLDASEFRREAVHDIQQVALDSIIEETGYVNLSENQPKQVRLVNISVERAIKDYLYLDHMSNDREKLNHDLSDLKRDINLIYKRCAWNVSQYNFALQSSYESSELFLSNVDIDNADDLPMDRAASITSIILEGERIMLTLYIWR